MTETKKTLGDIIKEEGRTYKWVHEQLLKNGIYYHYNHFVRLVVKGHVKPSKSNDFSRVCAEILNVEQSKIEQLWN